MFGLEPSGDTSDEDEVIAILRQTVAAATVPQARAVLEEAAEELVSTARFEPLVRALAPVLRSKRILQGVEIEEILRQVEEWNRRLERIPTSRVERHSLGTRFGPWYEVISPSRSEQSRHRPA